MICCLHCCAELPSLRGLGIHLARRHDIFEGERRAMERRNQAGRIACPQCSRDFQQGKGLAVHLAQAHGIASTHPKTNANRRALKLPTVAQREPLPTRPDGPIALLESIISIAHFDAQTDHDAAAWLAEVRQGLRKGGANGEA